MPRQIAPAFSKACTTGEDCSGKYEYFGHAAVVARPSTSILSFTEKGMPHNGLSFRDDVETNSAILMASDLFLREIHILSSEFFSILL